MNAKRKKFDLDTKTVIYILIVVLIVAGIGYFVFTNSDNSEDILSVREVNLNKEKYIGKQIEVKGIFYSEGEDENYLKSTFTTVAKPNPEDQLILNLENIDNDTIDNLTEDQQYIATGTLTVVSEYGTIVELVVTDIKNI